jgi:hypothetical protein
LPSFPFFSEIPLFLSLWNTPPQLPLNFDVFPFFCTQNIDCSFSRTFYLIKNIRSFWLSQGAPLGENAGKVLFLPVPAGFSLTFYGFAFKNVLPAMLPYSEKINSKTAFLSSTIFPYLMNSFSLLMV